VDRVGGAWYTFGMIAIVIVSAMLAAAPAPAKKIAALDLELKGYDKNGADLFSELLQNELRSHGLQVIARSDIEALLGLERMKDALACNTTSCLVEIGGALGVDEILSGAIGAVDNDIVITLKRIDPSKGAVLKQAVRRVEGKKRVLDSAASLAAELFGWPPPAEVAAPAVIPATEPARKFAAPDGTSQQLSLTAREDDDTYDVVVEQGDKSYRCDKPVSKAEGCTLSIPRAKATLVVTGSNGTYSANHLFDVGATRYELKFRRRWPWIVWLSLGVVAAVGGGVQGFYVGYTCSRTDPIAGCQTHRTVGFTMFSVGLASVVGSVLGLVLGGGDRSLVEHKDSPLGF
jgi:hypothetical protein